MSIAAQVRATALLDFPAVALEAGIDPYSALRDAGIDIALLSRGDMTIPADRVAWLLDGVAERGASPILACAWRCVGASPIWAWLGLSLASKQPFGMRWPWRKNMAIC